MTTDYDVFGSDEEDDFEDEVFTIKADKATVTFETNPDPSELLYALGKYALSVFSNAYALSRLTQKLHKSHSIIPALSFRESLGISSVLIGAAATGIRAYMSIPEPGLDEMKKNLSGIGEALRGLLGR